jgi:CBS domain-containing membrane protein
MSAVLSVLRRLVPALAPVSMTERLRVALGALVGILFAGLTAGLLLGDGDGLPLLIAPMGASAVLLFAVPTSPLAQPWSILGGNTVAALIGVTCARYIGDPVVAAALAGSLAITAMMALRCLHPPSGAVALTAVLGGPAIQSLGYGFVLWPVAMNSVLLVIAALVFNNLTGRTYPHLQPLPADNVHGSADSLPSARLGVSSDDIAAVLAQHDLVLPVSPDELEHILHRAEQRAFDRRSGGVTCADVMSRDVVAITPRTRLRDALVQLRAHHIKALPVIDDQRRVVGIVTQTDLLDKADWGVAIGGSAPRWPLQAIGQSLRGLTGTAEEIMSRSVRSARPEMHIAQVIPFMADEGLHHLPVVDEEGRLVGILTQSDLVAAMFAVSASPSTPEQTSAPA